MTGAKLTGLVFLLAAACAFGAPNFTLQEGDLDGVPFAVAKPTAAWIHEIVILAPERRPESAPRKVLIPANDPFCKSLLAAGWMVASIAPPRNGTVIAASVAALLRLRARIEEDNGSVNRAVVVGEGLGGLDAVLLAEQLPGAFTGALAIDPTLNAREDDGAGGASLDPKIPLLILSTQKGALSRAIAYVTSKMPRPGEDPRPALVVVSRDGLCNVNEAERFAAFSFLQSWLTNGPGVLPEVPPNHPFIDITSPPPDRPMTATLAADGALLTAHVLSVDPFDGSFHFDARPNDLAAAGFALRGYFSLTVGGITVRARVLPKGFKERSADWLVYPDADGYVRAVPRYEASPALPAEPGAQVTIAPPAPVSL